MGRRRVVAVLAASVIMMAGTGCWPTRGQGPDRTGHNPVEQAFTSATVDQIELQWTFDTSWPNFRPIPTSAVVSNTGGVHVASMTERGYRLFALDPATGTVRWSQQLDSRGLSVSDAQSPPWVAEDTVFVSTVRDNWNIVDTDHGVTQAFDAATGEDLGVVADGGDLQAMADDAYGALVVPDTAPHPTGTSWTMWAGQLVSVGGTLRRIDLAANEFTSREGFGGVTIGQGLIFHSGAGVMSTGPGPTEQQRAVRAYSITSPGEVACGPVGDPGRLVECPAWVTPPLDLPPGSAPVLDSQRSRLFVSADFSGLRAFDMATGAEAWRGTWTIDAPKRTPALANGRLYAGTDFGLAVYDAAGCGAPACAPLWETGPLPSGEGSPGQALQQAAVAGDVVFVPVMADGLQARLVAFDADGCGAPRCEPIWGVDLPGRVIGELAISGGHIYVPTEQGLLAFGI
jgi:outer membrane protein assembly factor BamB